jgi:hypothetical protein
MENFGGRFPSPNGSSRSRCSLKWRPTNVVITQPDSIPDDLRRFEAKIDGPLWLDVIDALPKTLAEPLAASVKSSEPSNSAIKQRIANGGVLEGASVKRGYHLRIE